MSGGMPDTQIASFVQQILIEDLLHGNSCEQEIELPVPKELPLEWKEKH